MATQTTNFGLTKIDLTDVADITVLNENFDKIDEQLLKAGESGGTDLIETEAASIIEGDAPEIDPVIQNELNKLDAELTQQKDAFAEHTNEDDPHGASTLVQTHVANVIGREDTLTSDNTAYTTYMGRAIALVTSAPSSMTNGTCAFVYA